MSAGPGALDALIARFEAANRRRQTGDATGALAEYEGCLATARSLGNRQAEGAVLGNLGNAYFSLGQYQRAIEHHTQDLAIAKKVGDRAREGNAYGSIGRTHLQVHQYTKAVSSYKANLGVANQFHHWKPLSE